MSYTKLNDNRVKSGYSKYRFDLRYNNVRYRKIVTCRKSAVNALHRQWEDSIFDGLIGNQSHRFFGMLDRYIEHVEFNKSKTAYVNELRATKRFRDFFKKNLLLSEFKRSMVDDYISWRRVRVFSNHDNTHRKGSVSNATINREISVLSCFFNWCIRKEFMTHNPAAMCKLKENNQREVRLSKDEIDILLMEAEKIDLTFHKVISLALLTGMRRSEILTLEWNEVHFDASKILLSALKTKSKRARVIPITDTIKGIL